jgi:hypothetical protein
MIKSDNFFIYHHHGGNDVIFEISDEDIAGDPSYFGYLAESGAWIIQKRTASTGAYRYIMGQSGYAAAWSGRAGLTYVLYSAL